MSEQIEIFGQIIQNHTYKEIVSLVKENIGSKSKLSFHNVNVSILLTCLKDSVFKKNLDSFSMLFSDGTGIYWASKLFYGKKGLKERLTGTDLYYHILNLANELNLKCFFFGGSTKAVDKLPVVLESKFPGIQVTGIIPREIDFKVETFDKIKNSNSDILFLGLGSPYQEKWIAENFQSIDIPIQIAVGSGIEFISEAKKRAPKILRNLGLEWVYRIYLEPRRLWKRYIFGIPIFMFKIIVLKVKLLIKKQK